MQMITTRDSGSYIGRFIMAALMQ